MDRSKLARIYHLVLDPADKMAALLIAAIDTYLAIKQAEKPISSDKYTGTCPFCGSRFVNKTDRDSRRAISAHVRQIHPVEFRTYYKQE